MEVEQFVIRGPLTHTIRVHYSVTPEWREGNSHTGYTGNLLGHLDRRSAFFTGRNVLLLPQPATRLERAAVVIQLPSGWKASTPWREARGVWKPGLGGRYTAEDLLSGVVGCGRFRERVVIVGATRFEFLFESSIPDIDERAAMVRFEKVARYFHSLFRRSLGTTYRTLVFPPTAAGGDLLGDGWANGQGGSLAPATTKRVHRFAERLLDAYAAHEPYRSEISKPEEVWLVDGIRRFYSWRAVARAGLSDDDEVTRNTVRGYLLFAESSGARQNLERAYESPEASKLARDYQAPVLLLSMDRLIRTSTAGRTTLDDLIGRVFHGRRALSFWSSLPAAPPGLWEEFRTTQLRGGNPLLAPTLPSMTPTQSTPSPRPGRPVRHLTLAYTGDSHGFLEHCGCKLDQSGGVARRATAVRALRSADPALLLVDAGNSFERLEAGSEQPPLSRDEQRLYLRSMDLMGYDAAAVGTTELLLGTSHFRDMTRRIGTPFLSCNLRENGKPFATPYRIVTRAGIRVGIIGAIEPRRGRHASTLFEQSTKGLLVEDAANAILACARGLAEATDLIVVIGDLSPVTVRKVAAASERGIDVVVSSMFDVPRVVSSRDTTVVEPNDAPGFLGSMLVLYTSALHYGIESARIGIDAHGRVASAELKQQRLGEDVPDDPIVRRSLDEFYAVVGKTEAAQRSVRPPFLWDPVRQSGRYVGAAACRECHEGEYQQWHGTRHASAFKTLLDRHRHYQPECVSCHVVGYGTTSGYRIGAGEDPLGNVQCEVCHGPGAGHIRAPTATNIVRTVPERVCLECHDEDHSDHFVYEEHLPRVRHGHDG